jgi:hypothetical protein
MLKEYITLKDLFDIPGLQDHIGEIMHTLLFMICDNEYPELQIGCSISLTRDDLIEFMSDERHPFVCQVTIDIAEE